MQWVAQGTNTTIISVRISISPQNTHKTMCKTSKYRKLDDGVAVNAMLCKADSRGKVLGLPLETPKCTGHRHTHDLGVAGVDCCREPFGGTVQVSVMEERSKKPTNQRNKQTITSKHN